MLTASGQSSVMLAWNPAPDADVVSYKLYYGGSSATYTNLVSVNGATNATVSGLTQGATYYFAVTAVNSVGLESLPSSEVNYAVPSAPPPNTAPVISSIANQALSVNTATAALAFTVGDAETSANNLVVTASSSNPTLLPNTSIVLGGSGANRTVTLTPAANQTGTATVTLRVCDPSLCATTAFLLTVTAPSALPAVALSAPTDGACYSGPANISLCAAVTPNGHTINKVQFFNGTVLLGDATASPYELAWNNVAMGTYSVTAQAVYDGGSTICSAPATVTVTGLPAPWQTGDLGSVGASGNAAFSAGLYTVQGAGAIGGSSDSFRFLYQPLSGDGEIRAQITSVQDTGTGGCVGVMIRENLTSGSRNALMGVSAGATFRWQRRNKTGAGTSSSKAGGAFPPSVWVRLVRTGNTISGYKSTDGANWVLVNSAAISMAANVYVGVAVASGTSGVLNTSVFGNVSVVP